VWDAAIDWCHLDGKPSQAEALCLASVALGLMEPEPIEDYSLSKKVQRDICKQASLGLEVVLVEISSLQQL
jgi:hypothetical protein